MTEMAERDTWDPPSEVAGSDEYPVVRPSVSPAGQVAKLREVDLGEGVRSELQYVMSMRQLGRMYLASHPATAVQTLLWRLIGAVAVAAAVAASGATLTSLALVGGSVKPNPYVSLSLLLVGLALCATVLTVVRDRRDRPRRR